MPATRNQIDPRQQVVEYLAGGVVTLFIGIAFMAVAKVGFVVLAIPGFICIAVGLALLLAACFTWPVSKLLGLIPARSPDRA